MPAGGRHAEPGEHRGEHLILGRVAPAGGVPLEAGGRDLRPRDTGRVDTLHDQVPQAGAGEVLPGLAVQRQPLDHHEVGAPREVHHPLADLPQPVHGGQFSRHADHGGPRAGRDHRRDSGGDKRQVKPDGLHHSPPPSGGCATSGHSPAAAVSSGSGSPASGGSTGAGSGLGSGGGAGAARISAAVTRSGSNSSRTVVSPCWSDEPMTRRVARSCSVHRSDGRPSLRSSCSSVTPQRSLYHLQLSAMRWGRGTPPPSRNVAEHSALARSMNHVGTTAKIISRTRRLPRLVLFSYTSRRSTMGLRPSLVSLMWGTMNVLDARVLVCKSHAYATISDRPARSSRLS